MLTYARRQRGATQDRACGRFEIHSIRGLHRRSALREGGDVIVSVHDNGKGFSPNSLKYAFELFNQGDEPGGRGEGGV